MLMLRVSRCYYFSGLLGIKILTCLPGYSDLGPGQSPRLCVQQMPSDSYLMFEKCTSYLVDSETDPQKKDCIAFTPPRPNTLHPVLENPRFKGLCYPRLCINTNQCFTVEPPQHPHLQLM